MSTRSMRLDRLPGILGLLVCLWATAASPEPFTVVTETAALGGETAKIDVYRPARGAATGVAILAHGFTRDRTRHRDLARELAGAGVVAVVPDLPGVGDHEASGEALEGLAHDVEKGALGLPATPLSHLVLVGTSAGGLATVIAASRLPGLAGWVGLDPVDMAGSGARAAAKLEPPAVVLLAEPSRCNLYGSGGAIAAAAPALLRSEVVSGSSHCDFEGPTNRFCRIVCGRSPPSKAEEVRAEAVRAVRELLGRARGPADPTATSGAAGTSEPPRPPG